MLSQIEACSLPLLYKLSAALPAGKQTYPKKDKTNLRIDCGLLLFIFSLAWLRTAAYRLEIISAAPCSAALIISNR